MKGNGILGPNGRAVRQPQDKGSDLATKADAQAIAVQVAEYYANQVPDLVGHMIGDALTAYHQQITERDAKAAAARAALPWWKRVLL